MSMFSNHIRSKPSLSLSKFLSRFLSLDHSHGGNIEDDWEYIIDRELQASDEDEDMFVKGDENDDQSDDVFLKFHSSPSSNYANKAKYTILSKAEVRQCLEDKIKEVSSVLMLSKNDAAILLQHFKWDVNRATEEWLACESKVREAVGLFARPVVETPANGTDQITCIVCQTKYPSLTILSISCGHQICFNCWEVYISEAVNDGPRCLSLHCPLLSCDAAVGPIFIESLSSEDDEKKFEDHLLRSYLAGSHKGKWCPAPDCNYAVFSSNGEEGNVTCRCLHSFCWNCLGEAHAPVHCEVVRQWASEMVTQSENWVFANTITCPKCKTAAAQQTKTSLFVYERCNVCSYAYCRDCGADWFNNDKEGIRVHKCNGDNGLRSLTKKSLEKYNLYYERWSICESNRANALTDLKLLKDLQLEGLCDVFDICTKDLDFVVEALLQVIECWQFLKWTYVYGYYMPETEEVKKNLFEFMQEEATSLVERLHKLFEELYNSIEGENPIVQFVEFRSKLIKLTRVVGRYFDHFMEGLYCGLPEVVSIPPFRPRLKSQQGKIGSGPALIPCLRPMANDMSDCNPISNANSDDWCFTPNTASVLPEDVLMSEIKNQ